jgi:hypothetical protein
LGEPLHLIYICWNFHCESKLFGSSVRDFADTTAIFEEPKFTWRIKDKADSSMIVELISEYLLENQFDENASTALMIGRYQPFHAGHKALFEKALQRHGQVCIAVRDMPRNDKNPLDALSVVENIHDALKEYRGKYVVVVLPNIVDVVYGRDVGWTVSKIDLPPEIEAISATKIRESMNKFNTQKHDFAFSAPSKTPADVNISEVMKTGLQNQWNITFNGTKYDLDEHGQPMWNGGHGGEA